MGDVVAIFGCYLFINVFKISWEWAFGIFMLGFLVCAIVFYLGVPEMSVMEEELAGSERVAECYEVLGNFLAGNLPAKLWMADNILQEGLSYNILMWFPYFFEKSGFGYSIMFISVIFQLMVVPGTVCFEAIASRFPSIEKKLQMFLLLVITVLTILLIFIEPSQHNQIYYLLLVGIIGFLSGGPCNRANGSELI